MRSKTCPFMSFGLLLLILSGLRPENWALPIFEGRFNFKFQYLWYFGPQQCVCIYIYIYTHTHQPPFSFQLTLLSLTLHLTVGPSSVTAGLNFLSLTLARHSRSVMFYSYLLYAFLFKIILFYIYIYILYSIWDVCFIWIPFAQQRYEESHDIIAKYPNRVPVCFLIFPKTH